MPNKPLLFIYPISRQLAAESVQRLAKQEVSPKGHREKSSLLMATCELHVVEHSWPEIYEGVAWCAGSIISIQKVCISFPKLRGRAFLLIKQCSDRA